MARSNAISSDITIKISQISLDCESRKHQNYHYTLLQLWVRGNRSLPRGLTIKIQKKKFLKSMYTWGHVNKNFFKVTGDLLLCHPCITIFCVICHQIHISSFSSIVQKVPQLHRKVAHGTIIREYAISELHGSTHNTGTSPSIVFYLPFMTHFGVNNNNNNLYHAQSQPK